MAAQSQKMDPEIRAKVLEGVDFIETEEDAEAVESAVVKIQSTFRGKKIRSKLGQKSATATATAAAPTDTTSKAAPDSKAPSKTQETTKSASASGETASEQINAKQPQVAAAVAAAPEAVEEQQLSKKVASMQVNDNSSGAAQSAGQQKEAALNASSNLPEEEAERAATKIQAGFKGYKTRKELEGKLAAQQRRSSDACKD